MNTYPDTWEKTTLDQFGEVVSGGTPDRNNPAYWKGEIPWVTPSEITTNTGKYLYDTREKITKAGLNASSAKLLPVNSLLITSRATLGEIAIAAIPVSTNQGFKSIIPNNDTDPVFAYYLIKTLKGEMVRLSSGTTFLEISKGDFSRIVARRPQLPEQTRIAYVLDTIDEAIAKTEAVIAKLKQVRAGMLHDLLSYGLDKDGQLRDPIAHPEQFKDSPLWRIPREWDVKALNECYAIPSRNGLYKKALCYGHGYRMIHMPQMFKGVMVDESEAVLVAVDQQELQRFSLQEGDLLFARRSLNLEGAGLCSMVGKVDEPITFESSIVRVRFNRELIVPRFAVEFLRSPLGYLLRRRFIRQVAVSGVSSSDIGLFLLPCPKLPEQEEILSRLYSNEKTLSLYEAEEKKLRHVKSGIQDDLLTGRVRVPKTIVEGAAVA